jgi:hypothetical protein
MLIALVNLNTGYNYYLFYTTGIININVTTFLYLTFALACEIIYQYVKRLEDPFIGSFVIIGVDEF